MEPAERPLERLVGSDVALTDAATSLIVGVPVDPHVACHATVVAVAGGRIGAGPVVHKAGGGLGGAQERQGGRDGEDEEDPLGLHPVRLVR